MERTGRINQFRAVGDKPKPRLEIARKCPVWFTPEKSPVIFVGICLVLFGEEPGSEPQRLVCAHVERQTPEEELWLL